MQRKSTFLLFLVISLFFAAYVILGITKHNHFMSGYDLSIVDQITWKYSRLKSPITTINSYAFSSIFADHIEFIYIFLSPFYWVWNDARMLIVLQALFISLSGIPIYFLAKKKLGKFFSFVILISYLMFFGIQNAVWNDVHSLVFGASFLSWFIFFLETNNKRGIWLSFFLSIFCKEDIALLTFFICFVYFVKTKQKIAIYLMAVSFLYLFTIFYIFFPHFTLSGYRFQDSNGLLSNIKLSYIYDTSQKKEIWFYSFAWFGFIPFLLPLYLLPTLADFTHYFIFGHNVGSAQEIFFHYRVTLAPLLSWSTIIALAKYPKLKNYYVGMYLIFTVFLIQYMLHLPLSYLTKEWFWQEPKGVRHIESVLSYLPDDASVVSQLNIVPHIAHRDNIFTLWPEVRRFDDLSLSPCGKILCRWFGWVGNPKYLIADISNDWDIRHFLQNREDYIEALHNLEQEGIIVVDKRSETATLYKVLKNSF